MDRTQNDISMQSQETATNQAANAQSLPIGGSSVGATTPTYKILPPLVDTKRAPVFRFFTETNDRRKCIQDDCTHETGDKHASNLEKHLERHHRDANTELQRIKAEKGNTVTPTTTMRPLAAQAIRVLTVPRSGAVIESSFSLVQLLQVGHRQLAQSSGAQGTRRLSLSAEQSQNEMLIRMNDHLIKDVHCMQ
jgi:hypothetical protein